MLHRKLLKIEKYLNSSGILKYRRFELRTELPRFECTTEDLVCHSTALEMHLKDNLLQEKIGAIQKEIG